MDTVVIKIIRIAQEFQFFELKKYNIKCCKNWEGTIKSPIPNNITVV